jgi:Urease accessory protein UreH
MPSVAAMFDAPAPPILQRTRGEARVALRDRRGATRLERLRQAGSAKAFLPRIHGPDPEVVFLNTAGGLTGGDRLSYGLALGPGTRAVGTTQTAERAYASPGGRAEVTVDLEIGAGARLDWLPQETILFDRSALARRTEARLAADAELLMLETLQLGRTAMGEEVATLDLADILPT